MGVNASRVSTGRGNDQIAIDVFGGTQAIGLKDSYLNSGIGNDKINIVVSSNGSSGHSYSYKKSYVQDGKYASKYSSAGLYNDYYKGNYESLNSIYNYNYSGKYLNSC